jgi:hypothetical protein
MNYPNILVAATQSRGLESMLSLLFDMGVDTRVIGPLALKMTFDLVGCSETECFLVRGIDPNAPCDEHPNPLISAVSVPVADLSNAL